MIRTSVLAAMIALCPALLCAANLKDIPVDGKLRIPALTLDTGKSISVSPAGDIELQRIELYAHGARILAPDGKGGFRLLPRNPEIYFTRSDGNLRDPFFIALSPDGKRFRGVVLKSDGELSFSGVVADGALSVQKSQMARNAEAEYRCETDGQLLRPQVPSGAQARPRKPRAKAALGSLHEAIVAIDTDYELIDEKFGGSTGAATTFLTDLFAGMNVMYERDLDVRLVLGDTFLRDVALPTDDPYSAATPSTQLDEVAMYWNTTPALHLLDRAFVAFLSGKGPANSASGIAWIIEDNGTFNDDGNYCAQKGPAQVFGTNYGHYSATQLFEIAVPLSLEVSLIGHEIGHNFGASHTHCTDINTGAFDVSTNTVDQCYAAESGCYAGSTSCPTDNSVSGRGSVMSYCHVSPSGCGSNLAEFHPTHQGALAAPIATSISKGCLTAIGGGGPNDIFANGFE